MASKQYQSEHTKHLNINVENSYRRTCPQTHWAQPILTSSPKLNINMDYMPLQVEMSTLNTQC